MIIIFGLQVSGEVLFLRFEVETNNLQLALLLQHHSSPLNLSLLMDNILVLFRYFKYVRFGYFCKETNEPTHYIARLNILSTPLCI